MDLQRNDYTLRELTLADAPSLARHADDPDIASHMRDRFPHPYRQSDAEFFIAMIADGEGEQAWAIDHQGEAVGVVGAFPGTDVYSGSWEIGYWVGRAHWGRGVITSVVQAVCLHLFDQCGARRVWAGIFSGNPASERVLEKAGFTSEGVARAHVVKNGEVRDEIRYGLIPGDLA